jgi:pimeloyl-ACP methyl ester carboxylesterase
MNDWLEAQEAALNAVLGDYLERRGNPLAIEMQLYERGRPLPLTTESLRATHRELTPRIVILVHGMAQTESCWAFPADSAASPLGRDSAASPLGRDSAASPLGRDSAASYGALLHDELGLTPFYLRYNTGRHVSQNGRELALLLERLLAAYPIQIDDISLIGHSMGGLVIRSACYYAEELGLTWLTRARRAFYLGVPHLGSPYEKAGHLLSVALGSIDHPVVRLTGTLGNLRSAGVKDLRHGSLLDEDWQGQDLDALDAKRPRIVPLCAGMAHYLVAGALTQSENHLLAQLLGDALVRLPSATDPGHRAALPPEHFALLPGVHHMGLAHSPQVYSALRAWFGEPPLETASTKRATADPSPALATSTREARLERLDAYRALLQDAVEHGSTAVEQVQAELSRRPYDLLEQIPPLEAPTRLVRSAHSVAVRGVYGMIRAVNAVTGAALHEGIDWLKKIG